MSQRIVLTTTASVPNREIKEVMDIVSAEVAAGMNIFKDMFSAVRDVVGGRAAEFTWSGVRGTPPRSLKGRIR